MANRKNITPGHQNRMLVGPLLWGVGIIGVLFVAFLIYYTVIAPERIADPTEIGSEEVPQEGVAVPDGGDLTGTPNQADPTSPARDAGTGGTGGTGDTDSGNTDTNTIQSE